MVEKTRRLLVIEFMKRNLQPSDCLQIMKTLSTKENFQKMTFFLQKNKEMKDFKQIIKQAQIIKGED